VRNWSLLLDIYIIFKTFFRLFIKDEKAYWPKAPQGVFAEYFSGAIYRATEIFNLQTCMP
jgi:hypothetical protein